jgi:hypothetical protein
VRVERLGLLLGQAGPVARAARHGALPAEASSSLRLSLSRLTTAAEVDRALEIVPAAVAGLRSLLGSWRAEGAVGKLLPASPGSRNSSGPQRL